MKKKQEWRKKGKTEPVVSLLGEHSINFNLETGDGVLEQYKAFTGATTTKDSLLRRIREAKTSKSLGQPSGNRRTRGARFVLRDVKDEKKEEPDN